MSNEQEQHNQSKKISFRYNESFYRRYIAINDYKSTAKNGKSIVEEKILNLESNFEHFFLYFNKML